LLMATWMKVVAVAAAVATACVLWWQRDGVVAPDVSAGPGDGAALVAPSGRGVSLLGWREPGSSVLWSRWTRGLSCVWPEIDSERMERRGFSTEIAAKLVAVVKSQLARSRLPPGVARDDLVQDCRCWEAYAATVTRNLVSDEWRRWRRMGRAYICLDEEQLATEAPPVAQDAGHGDERALSVRERLVELVGARDAQLLLLARGAGLGWRKGGGRPWVKYFSGRGGQEEDREISVRGGPQRASATVVGAT
jgi:hypothetical protein